MVDRIFVRAGATDDITQGRSTFLVEMSETSYILHHATARSLVVLDEVGRGTSTYDGLSIAWAVAEEMHDATRARTLFATHFHELTGLVDHLAAARNYTLAVTEEGHQVIFLRQLIAGCADKSYGIQVARLAGLPDHVIARAREVLSELQEHDSVADHIEVQQTHGIWSVAEGMGTQLQPVDEQALWTILRELYHLDIANTTPVQALIVLNDLQSRLLRARGGTGYI
jgi:DNA mismatch repair protein MutS